MDEVRRSETQIREAREKVGESVLTGNQASRDMKSSNVSLEPVMPF